MREMKDSGFEYIGDIPKSWRVIPLKFVASCNDDTLSETTDPYMTISYVDISSVSLEKGITNAEIYSFEKAPSRARRLAKENDIIISTVRTYLRAIACVDAGHTDCVFSTGFAVVRPRNIFPKFLDWVSKADSFINYVMYKSNGVSYPSINAIDLMNIFIPEPSIEEQMKIASYLDSKCSQIDAAISRQESLIEKLEEYRRSVITEAVTKGLDPDAEMKDSGIPWIDRVPASWRICPLYSIIDQVKNINKGLKNENLLSLSYGRIKRKDINSNEGLLPASFETYNVIEPGDIVLRLTDLQNDKKSLRVGLCKEKGIITSAYVTVRPKHCNPSFLYYVLHSYDLRKVFYDLGTGLRESMKYDDIKRLLIYLPSEEEQKRIVSFLEVKNNQVDIAIQRQKSMIEKLKAYRQSLIYEVVTGKKELRG